ncbi:MAG: hypothetical protein Q4C06_07565 [Bacillota bacterium]|nr:hypothetical protein [Bacillota bacterium]
MRNFLKNKIFGCGGEWWKGFGGKKPVFVESGGDSPFLVEKNLENWAFLRNEIFGICAFWTCIFVAVILQCG